MTGSSESTGAATIRAVATWWRTRRPRSDTRKDRTVSAASEAASNAESTALIPCSGYPPRRAVNRHQGKACGQPSFGSALQVARVETPGLEHHGRKLAAVAAAAHHDHRPGRVQTALFPAGHDLRQGDVD